MMFTVTRQMGCSQRQFRPRWQKPQATASQQALFSSATAPSMAEHPKGVAMKGVAMEPSTCTPPPREHAAPRSAWQALARTWSRCCWNSARGTVTTKDQPAGPSDASTAAVARPCCKAPTVAATTAAICWMMKPTVAEWWDTAEASGVQACAFELSFSRCLGGASGGGGVASSASPNEQAGGARRKASVNADPHFWWIFGVEPVGVSGGVSVVSSSPPTLASLSESSAAVETSSQVEGARLDICLPNSSYLRREVSGAKRKDRGTEEQRRSAEASPAAMSRWTKVFLIVIRRAMMDALRFK
mmetsp:Transcript_24621/g.82428  ORF Transcript_24621/g.82428 Transcript_24621/m.82428 type:complete len:301 (+) Transcript_24621:269-1171(+)